MDLNLYDAFGNHLADTATATGDPETLIDPVGFGGEYGYYFDKETGKSLLGHRYYDSTYGRFLNRDPIGYNGGINLYGYAGNDPITGSDPSGLSKDPMPTNDPNWVRVSVALFIPMKEFYAGHSQGLIVKHKGDGRGFDYNTDADRVRVDFALNTKTGKLIPYGPHTAGSTMTLWNGFQEHATSTMTSSVTSKKSAAGWIVTVKAGGTDPFYDIGNIHTSPPASVTAQFYIQPGAIVHGNVHFRPFPSMEIYAYNSRYPGGHRFLTGYQPPPWIQHTIGPISLYHGENHEANF